MPRRAAAAGSSPPPRRHSGAAAVEFVLIFPLLFMLMYGIVVYSYIFIIQETLSYVAQEAAETAVAVDSADEAADDPDATALRQSRVRATAVSLLDWMPDDQKSRVLGDDSGSAVAVTVCPENTPGCPSDTDGLRVTLTYTINTPTPLFPVISLGGIGSAPPMPSALSATAVVRI